MAQAAENSEIPDPKKLQPDEDPSIFSEYGLGYGVDATNNHGRSIVREIEKKCGNIKQRRESGAYKYYNRKMVSGKDISLKCSTTLAVDQMKMGSEANVSRSTSHSLVEIGSRSHTRTIYFTSDESKSFEKMLKDGVNFDHLHGNSDQLLQKCKIFVGEHRCTHYVKAILLGAVEREELKLEEYTRVFNASGNIEAKAHHVGAGASGGLQKVVNERRRDIEYTKLGRWDDNHQVVDERVIDIEIAPIHELVKTRLLQNTLKDAVKEYREENTQEECKCSFIMQV